MEAAEPGHHVIAPERYDDTGPGVFLAGPIQGADDWQALALAHLGEVAPQLHVYSPRRAGGTKGEFDDARNIEQINWETHYLRRCGENGAIIFWLAGEAVHVPGRSYAQTTRFELGEWKERAMRGEANLVLGIDSEFTNARYIRHRVQTDCPQVPICATLEATCIAAAVLARQGAGRA